MSEKETSNILQFKKDRHFNIGILIFGFIFLYLVATVIMFLTAPRVTAYEVRQGSILKDTAFTGLAIRKEIVVQAAEDGYINYYAPDSGKVKVGSKVYTLSNQELVFSDASDVSAEEVVLSHTEEQEINRVVHKFNQDYTVSNFADTYRLKSDIKSVLSSLNNNSKLEQLNTLLDQGNNQGIEVFHAKDDGIVVYTLDGMESLSKKKVDFSHLNRENYQKNRISDNSQVSAGDPIYKIITSEMWTLMIELDSDTAALLKEKTYVKVKFTKDDETAWAELKIKERDGRFLAYLEFDKAMVRYASERYLQVELILEDESGLKIPKTAKTKKDFYVVPKSYLTQGGNSSNDGVLVKKTDNDGNVFTAFETVEVYYEDEEVVYLNPHDFEKDATLIMPDSNTTLRLSEMRSLEGVYCINRGYAMFKQITILCESDSYYIVEEGSSYGLSNYDHIALDSSNLKENDVVF